MKLYFPNIFKSFLIVLIFTFSLISCGFSQENAMPPSQVKENFLAKYSNAEDLHWEKDAHGYYEAQFKEGEAHLRADFKSSGQWIETEQSITYQDLPSKIREIIEAEYDEEEIVEIEKVDHFEKGIFFDVEFKDKGKNKDIQFTAEGRIIK